MGPDPASMRLVTLDIWKSEGRHPERMAVMAEALAREAPDVLCLRDVFRCDGAGWHTADRCSSAAISTPNTKAGP